MNEMEKRIGDERNEFLQLIREVEQNVDHYETFGDDETDYYDEDGYLILRVLKTGEGNIIYDFGPSGTYKYQDMSEKTKIEEEPPVVTEETDMSLYCDAKGENPYDAWMGNSEEEEEFEEE